MMRWRLIYKKKQRYQESFLKLKTYRAHQIMEHVVNVNYRGQLKKPVNVKKLTLLVKNLQIQHKYHLIPHQLVIKDDQGTIIFFSSGKIRVMGCVHAIDASFLAFKYSDLIDTNDIPELYSQSYTSVVKLGYEINLDKLAECREILYIPNCLLLCVLQSINLFLLMFFALAPSWHVASKSLSI